MVVRDAWCDCSFNGIKWSTAIFKENEEDNIITVKKTNNKKKVTFKEDEIHAPKENKNILLQAMKNDLFIFMMKHWLFFIILL